MAIKTVLLVIASTQDDREVDRAIAICAAQEAFLTVLVLGIAPPPPASPYGVVSNDIWAGEIRDGQQAAETRAEAVREKLRRADLRGEVQAQYIDRGTVATLCARYARYGDLTLITPRAEGFGQMQGWVMNGALFESGRPILIMPKGEVHFPRVDCAIIAWDASVEASKAVHESIEILQGAGAVHAVLIDPVPSFDGHGPEPGADLAAYLARHGISATVHRVPKEGQDVARILQRVARDMGADLIVMGGFGHSRLRQRIFGGTTTTMLEEAELPVLMAH